jgi:hypothetical protein
LHLGHSDAAFISMTRRDREECVQLSSPKEDVQSHVGFGTPHDGRDLSTRVSEMVSQLQSNSLSDGQVAESAYPVGTAQFVEPNLRARIVDSTGTKIWLMSPRPYRPKYTSVTEREKPDGHG